MSKKKIMIVDDSAVMRVIINNVLRSDENLNAVVSYASNGQEALDKLGEFQPDLILLDIEMPKMNGLEFLRHARLKSRAKIVVLSAVTLPGGSKKTTQARALGADAVISKPSGTISFDLEEKRGDELRQTIYAMLGLEAKP
jgi:chemotaxis response regulator CheB